MAKKQTSNSKNVIVDSNISVGDNLHIGDKLQFYSTEKINQEVQDTIIILEIAKIQEAFYEPEDWKDRAIILRKIQKYSNHSSLRVSIEAFSLLFDIAGLTRAGLTVDVAFEIFSGIQKFFPDFNSTNNAENIVFLVKQGVEIGDHLTYDALMYLKDLKVAIYGFAVFKYFYLKADNQNLPELKDLIISKFEEIMSALENSNEENLENGIELLRIYKKDLDSKSLSRPKLPDNLNKLT